MSEFEIPDDAKISGDSADLHGLPQREESSGRDELEQIASEFLLRLRAGYPVSVEDYQAKFPDRAEEIADFLQLVGAMEDWKARQEVQSIRQPIPEDLKIEMLGNCRIIREIARGGMGVIFEAEQQPIGRRVAVKLLPWKFPKGSPWAEQFIREARIAAGLQHSNIIPVFSFGEQDDRYYYSMQLIEGVGLDKLIGRWKSNRGVVAIEDLVSELHPELISRGTQGRRLVRHDSWAQLAKIAAQVASALRYAHNQGTLHRDIKPGNLLIDVNGKVWIADFGLAMAREKALLDQQEILAGTMRYMAPEQFAGEGDERSDLYSFGATLYELTTLQPAYPSRTKAELLRDIRRALVPPPRTVNAEIPRQLQAIIQKAMARDADQRYQSAEELHAALLDFLNGRSRARGGRVWKRIRRWF